MLAFLVVLTGCASLNKPVKNHEQFNQSEKSACTNLLDKNYFSDLKVLSVHLEKWKFGQEEETIMVEVYSFRCGKDIFCRTENYIRHSDSLWIVRYMRYDTSLMLNGKLAYISLASCVFEIQRKGPQVTGYKIIGTPNSDASFIKLIEKQYNAELVLD